MKSPILISAFNRPDTLKRLLTKLEEIKPSKLFIFCDAPREGNKNDEINSKEVRELCSNIKWECELNLKFPTTNLGCKNGLSSAISWFFENVEQGIILEDDCFPCDSFFSFCDEMLDRYKNNDEIMMISGNNFQHGHKVGNADYYFSKNICIWGWATWKSAWSKYDIEMKQFEKFKKTHKLKTTFKNPNIRWYWTKMLNRTFSGEINTTWDYQWFYSIWNNEGLSIVPNNNLIQNIGFDGTGQHTNYSGDSYSIPTKNFKGELTHPDKIKLTSIKSDERAFTTFYKVSISTLKSIIKKIYSKKYREIVG